MAEVTLSTTVNLDDVKVKWREVYVSEGLNRKIVPSQPPGIYQGLRMIENLGSPRQVEIQPDGDTNFHMAVYQTSDGFSLTYWDRAGTAIILDLSDAGLDNEETIIAMEMDYQIGVDTTAAWKAFPLADYDALPVGRKSELVVLGTIDVPAAATNITTAMINFERATFAWRNLSKGALTWSPVIRNGDFEMAEDGADNIWYWRFEGDLGDGDVRATSADPYRGTKSLTFEYNYGDYLDLDLYQKVWVPVVAGQRCMVRFYKKNLMISEYGNCPIVLITFVDNAGSALPVVLVSIGVETALDANYVEVVNVFDVPAGASAMSEVRIGMNGDEATTDGIGVRIDDFQVYIETSGERNDLQRGVSGDHEVAGRLSIRDDNSPYTGEPVVMELNGSILQFERPSGDTAWELRIDGSVEVERNLELGAGVGITEDLAFIEARPKASGGNWYQLMWQSKTSNQKGYRRYSKTSHSYDLALTHTHNAIFNNTTLMWTRDEAGEVSTMVRIDADHGQQMFIRLAADSDTWDDTEVPATGWTLFATIGTEGKISLANPTTNETLVADPAVGIEITDPSQGLVLVRPGEGITIESDYGLGKRFSVDPLGNIQTAFQKGRQDFWWHDTVNNAALIQGDANSGTASSVFLVDGGLRLKPGTAINGYATVFANLDADSFTLPGYPGFNVKFNTYGSKFSRYDLYGWTDGGGDFFNVLGAVVRDTSVSDNWLFRFEDGTNTQYDVNLGSGISIPGPATTSTNDGTWYYMSLVILNHSPGEFLWRFGTSPVWGESDTIVYNNSLPGDGDMHDHSSWTWDFTMGLKSLNTGTEKYTMLSWVELFDTQEYDDSLD